MVTYCLWQLLACVSSVCLRFVCVDLLLCACVDLLLCLLLVYIVVAVCVVAVACVVFSNCVGALIVFQT